MAYGVKYRLDYCNSDNNNFRLDIEINGYSGDVFDIESTGEPFVLSKLNSNPYPKLETIRATEATLSIYKDANFNIEALKTSDETHIRVSHYMDSNLIWRGFALPEFFHSTIEEFPVITITATDRLGVLKNLPFDNIYEDVSFIDVIRKALLKTGNPLNIKSLVGFQEAGNIFANRPLSEVVSGERLFNQGGESINCFDAIKSTLDVFNCYITQYEGYWWIVNKEQQETGQGLVVEYDYTPGSIEIVSEKSFDRNTVPFDYVFTGGEEMIRPVLSEVGILGEFGGSGLYPQNNNFRSWNGNTPTAWIKGGSFNSFRFDDNVISYLANGDFDPEHVSDGSIPKLLHYNNVNLDPFGLTTGRMSSFAYLESNSIPIILDNVVDNKVTVNYDFNLTSKNHSFVCFCVILETNRTDNKYFLLNGSTGSFVKAGNDKNRIFGESIQYFSELRQGKYGAIVSDVVNTEMGDNAAISMSVKGSAVISADMAEFAYCKLYVRIMGTVNLLSYSNNIHTLVNSVTIDISSSKVKPKGNLYKLVRSGGTYTAKSDIATAIFSDYLTTGLNGYFYNYPSDDTSIIRPIGSTSWRTSADNEYLPVLRHSVRQISKLYGETQKELTISIEKSFISPIDLFSIACKEELYTVSRYTINYLTSEVNVVLSQIRRPSVLGQEFIFSYFGEEGGTNVSGLGSVSGGNGGGGGARQDLQTTTEQGNETTLDIKARGFRPTHFQGIPKVAPLSEDMEVGEWYVHVSPTAPSGETPTPGSDFYIKTANDANLSGIADGQLVSWSAGQSKFVPASFPSLTGYATQAWVNSQGFATQSWVNGQGFITQSFGDGRYKPIAYVPSWGDITGKPTIDVNASSNTLVIRDNVGNINANYLTTNSVNGVTSIIPVTLFGAIGGSRFIDAFSKQAVNQFLGMPANGDTLQSILDRGREAFGFNSRIMLSSTAGDDNTIPALGQKDYRLYLANNGGLYGMQFGVTGSGNGFIQQARTDGVATAYHLLLQPTGGSVVIGDTAPDPNSKLYVNGRITAPVVKAATLIIPTTAPTGLNAGEWGIYISPTI